MVLYPRLIRSHRMSWVRAARPSVMARSHPAAADSWPGCAAWPRSSRHWVRGSDARLPCAAGRGASATILDGPAIAHVLQQRFRCVPETPDIIMRSTGLTSQTLFQCTARILALPGKFSATPSGDDMPRSVQRMSRPRLGSRWLHSRALGRWLSGKVSLLGDRSGGLHQR
jgi:hypothetical protein